MTVVIFISIMVGLAGPSMMNALANSRASNLALDIKNLYNGARARATLGRAQMVRFTLNANGGQGGLVAYEGNNSSCVASNWTAIVAAGCGPAGFCTEQLNPATRQLDGEVYQLGLRTTGNVGTFTETDADMCYEANGISFWRAGAAVGAGLLMSSENGGTNGNLKGGFVMRVQRLDSANTPLSVDRLVIIPLGAAARVEL